MQGVTYSSDSHVCFKFIEYFHLISGSKLNTTTEVENQSTDYYSSPQILVKIKTQPNKCFFVKLFALKFKLGSCRKYHRKKTCTTY